MKRRARGILAGLASGLAVLASMALAGAAALAGASAAGGEGDPAAGRQLAAARCASCHAFTSDPAADPAKLAGEGGPDLSFAGSKYRRSWLAAWLGAPRRIRAAGYLPFRYTLSTPAGDRVDAALLPAHPSLNAAEARDAAAWLASLTRPLTPYPVAPAATGIRADVHFEKLLPCGGCHESRPGKGGVSGPQLFSAAARLEREWALSWISDPVSWRRGLMPRSTLRSDQLAALGDYVFSASPAAAADGEEPAPSLRGAALSGERPPGAALPRLPAERGPALYLLLCSQCHGITGNGKGINASFLAVAPRDHSSFDEMNALSDEHLFAAIKRGGTAVGKSALMPSWGAVLEDADIHLLVDHLRRLSGTGAH